MKNLYEILIDKNKTISFAESITGGLLSYYLTTNSGSSKIFKGSIIAYSNQVKIDVLKVNKADIDKFSTVSSEIASQMVEGLSDLIKSDIHVSITGNAGPSFEENSSKLEVFYSILYLDKRYDYHHNFTSTIRQNNMNTCIGLILGSIRDLICL